MILNCGAAIFQWSPTCSQMRRTCSASTSTTADQLRQQLDNLNKEANTARAKANNARLRLMRLSEAAEKLRRQAAVNVQTGKENDARDLLFQKKKVMLAMEKLKNRIELFDELSAKLNEAISMKEGLLIGNMALDLGFSESESPSPIRIVSPKEVNPNNSDDNQQSDSNHLKSVEDQELLVFAESQEDIEAPRAISPYEEFMKNIDQHLNKIEEELQTFLRYSNLVLGNKEKPEYSRVQHVIEILEGVHQTRERIATILQTNTSFNEAPF
ncbi:hypothetical protein ACJIZ3_007263 [Penstemon smallii]|uniref:Uncharacterized protein n=1 Tax=Penstemon smallii TaxID=265156 RepID=A0ABD3SAA4_9LAMI